MLDIDFFGFFNVFESADVVGMLRESLTQIKIWVLSKYETAPALVLGIGFALALPAIATTGALFRMMFRSYQPTIEATPRTLRTQPASAWRQKAWLELSDNSRPNYPINHGMVRIGRETDNDLCLSDPTVHRYHAVLEQTPDAEYLLSYVGDPGKDGLFVNGTPVQRLRLRGGEVLEIGAIKLRFALSPV